MTKSFESKPQSEEFRKPIEFVLQGETFVFSPVKPSTQLIRLFTIKGKSQDAEIERAGSMLDWLAAGLDREYYKAWQKDQDLVASEGSQWKKLLDMLGDPDNPLELETVTEVITWLMGEVAGRPTT